MFENPFMPGVHGYDQVKEKSFRLPPRNEVNHQFFMDEVEVFFGTVNVTPEWRGQPVFLDFLKHFQTIWPWQWKRLREANILLRDCVRSKQTSVGGLFIAMTATMLTEQKEHLVKNANKARRGQGMQHYEKMEKYYLPIKEFSDKTTDKNIARRDKITLFREYFDKYWEENEDEIRKKSRPRRRKSVNQSLVQGSQSRPCDIHKAEFDNFRTAYYRWAKSYETYEKNVSFTDMINKLMLKRQDSALE